MGSGRTVACCSISLAHRGGDRTGHAIETAPARPAGGEEPVRILAALVNPDGSAPERETVTLINASPDPIDLRGWHLADRAKRTLALPAGSSLVLHFLEDAGRDVARAQARRPADRVGDPPVRGPPDPGAGSDG
ncbi:lamin tail domain-containing protein [Nonomuraea jabiensis]|uniref:lamin tail domain-containing protein n=1 Tax=Nonomuraea jabiensis TaxID=882448 RepID=UPI003D748834